MRGTVALTSDIITYPYLLKFANTSDKYPKLKQGQLETILLKSFGLNVAAGATMRNHKKGDSFPEQHLDFEHMKHTYKDKLLFDIPFADYESNRKEDDFKKLLYEYPLFSGTKNFLTTEWILLMRLVYKFIIDYSAAYKLNSKLTYSAFLTELENRGDNWAKWAEIIILLDEMEQFENVSYTMQFTFHEKIVDQIGEKGGPFHIFHKTVATQLWNQAFNLNSWFNGDEDESIINSDYLWKLLSSDSQTDVSLAKYYISTLHGLDYKTINSAQDIEDCLADKLWPNELGRHEIMGLEKLEGILLNHLYHYLMDHYDFEWIKKTKEYQKLQKSLKLVKQLPEFNGEALKKSLTMWGKVPNPLIYFPDNEKMGWKIVIHDWSLARISVQTKMTKRMLYFGKHLSDSEKKLLSLEETKHKEFIKEHDILGDLIEHNEASYDDLHKVLKKSTGDDAVIGKLNKNDNKIMRFLYRIVFEEPKNSLMQ